MRHPEKRRAIKNKNARSIWNNKTNEQKIDSHLKRRYNISYDEYVRLFEQQNQKCYICQNKITIDPKQRVTRAVVDHCHKTGKLRKFLCHRCNRTLGSLNEDIALMNNMINYIMEHSHDQ